VRPVGAAVRPDWCARLASTTLGAPPFMNDHLPSDSSGPVDVVAPTVARGTHPSLGFVREPVTGQSGDAAFASHERRTLDAPPVEGTLLDAAGRYRMRELLGEGGMGQVRLVDDRHIGRKVAVKTLHDDVVTAEESVGRFLREARVQGQLEHPSIVPVYDIGHDTAGHPYFTMRRLQGTTLRDVLEGARQDANHLWSRRKLLTAFVSVCMAVHYAHTRGVIHRDLKPTNIMLGEFGEVYVLDWGIARVQGQMDDAPGVIDGPGSRDILGSGPHATATGALLGTPAYMSPEQLRGQHNTLDGRSDVYALGMILYELCAARPFHSGKGFAAIASETLLGVRAIPSEAAPDTPPELDALAQKCTALDPAARFATVGELARAVEAYLDGDRDLQRRRDLAAEHAKRALDATERSQEATGGDYEALRKDAMRSVVQSLALDPEQREARKTFVRLLTEAPKEAPPAVRADLAAWALESRRKGLRFGVVGLLTWCAAIPAALALGVRDLPAALMASSTVVAFTLAMAWAARATRFHVKYTLAVAATMAVAIMSLSAWLGPFILVPAAATAILTMMAVFCEPTERKVLLGLGVVITLLPFGLEAADVVPHSFRMEEGRLVLIERVFALHPGRTLLGLLYTSAAFTIVPQLVMGRIRDEVLALQLRFVTQAWHLRQIVDEPDATRPAGG